MNKVFQSSVMYLKGLKNIMDDQIYVIGHSGGAKMAFSYKIKEDGIKKIVAIGPPRRVTERYSDPQEAEYFWKRALAMR